MSYKLKLLLTKNDGDWRRQSAAIFKCDSSLTFSDFRVQCARKLYPTELVASHTKILLYDVRRGLEPIGCDDDMDSPISELHEDGEIYRNCQLLVVLSHIHAHGIQNPSAQQTKQLQQEQALSAYLSSTVEPTASPHSHSVYTSASIGFSAPSNQSHRSRSFQNLSSLNSGGRGSSGSLPCHASRTLSKTRCYDQTPLLLARQSSAHCNTNSHSQPALLSPQRQQATPQETHRQQLPVLSPFQLPQIAPSSVAAVTIANISREKHSSSPPLPPDTVPVVQVEVETAQAAVYDQMLFGDAANIEDSDDELELRCTLIDEDDNLSVHSKTSLSSKRSRKIFEPSAKMKRGKNKKRKVECADEDVNQIADHDEKTSRTSGSGEREQQQQQEEQTSSVAEPENAVECGNKDSTNGNDKNGHEDKKKKNQKKKKKKKKQSSHHNNDDDDDNLSLDDY